MRSHGTIVIAALALASALLGCAQPVRNDFSFKEGDKVGVAIISVSHDASGGRNARAIFYLDGGVTSGRGSVLTSLREVLPGVAGGSDFEEDYGQVLALALPAGKHTIDTWQITNGTGLRIHPRGKPTPLVFEVAAGEVEYLGNPHGVLHMGKNIFHMTIVGDGYPEVRDQQQRDVAWIEEQYPQFKGKVVARLWPLGAWTGLETSKQVDIPPPPPSAVGK
jgi:hypothetical protein